ncbi:Clp protease N-terminal domain-containing protein [Nonomuraea sp. SYSU D8015]|uniref:Clp protease N-terminal domain-containing protein n=1 Tax=Nonomuraea sp. SYSU D8015 TaxID=2593644 RepID=UPI001660C55E|nr:Clp protease N-terminal domain-containing protein [Nonomuraea sp. SYSU D8015]
MVKDSARKKAIRERMAHTGKSYTDAAREMDQQAADRSQPQAVTFDWFSSQARHVVDLAREHARSRRHSALGTEHLLLGLLDDGAGGLAFEILDDLAGSVEAVESAIATAVPQGATRAPQEVPFSDHAAFVLAKGARRQADKTGHGYVGSEHILLALLSVHDCRACQILTSLGIAYNPVKTEVVVRLNAMGVLSRYHNPR